MTHHPPIVKPTGATEAVITTIGSLHGEIPETFGAHLLLDLRHALCNPFEDASMRHLTGLDPVVRDHVLDSPGAEDIVADTVGRLLALREYTTPLGHRADLMIMCRGGRHRSVAAAEEIARRIRARGIDVEVEHRDIDKPVIDTTATKGA